MGKKTAKRLWKGAVSLFFLVLSLVALGDLVYPDQISRFTGEDVESRLCFSPSPALSQREEGYESEEKRILAFGILPVKSVRVDYYPKTLLVPGGDLFGVRMEIQGLEVTGTGPVDGTEVSPAAAAGILRGDRILRADGVDIRGASGFTKIMAKSEGKPVSLEVDRNGQGLTLSVTPVKDRDGVYRAGLWVREAAAGIGTITFYDPESDTFAGLGHGICDGETGEVLPMREGSICQATAESIRKGAADAPGEIQGNLGKENLGELLANTPTGVYGSLKSTALTKEKKAVPIALKDEIQIGEATILCQLDEGGKKEYRVQIEEICNRNGETKNFVIHVTDEELLAKTGGVIQGMSGSPILQNGKLVGAVTHVLLRDPTRGYGIFIENMLQTARGISETGEAA